MQFASSAIPFAQHTGKSAFLPAGSALVGGSLEGLKASPMTEPRDPPRPEQKAAGAAPGSAKNDRLAAALRENLRRRKAKNQEPACSGPKPAPQWRGQFATTADREHGRPLKSPSWGMQIAKAEASLREDQHHHFFIRHRGIF